MIEELTNELMELGHCRPGVTEVYSPPRVTAMCSNFKLNPGLAMDLLTVDPKDGQPWDFSRAHKREMAIEHVKREKPWLVIGSPMCAPFSALQRLNFPRQCPEVVKELIRRGVEHIEFCTKLYRMQAEAGRFFLHEHPWSATSWSLGCIQRVLRMKGVELVRGDMCQFGMIISEAGGTGYLKKPTGFMTNSPEIAARLNKQCTANKDDETHQHVPIFNHGRAHKAAIYPPKLCADILKGLKSELEKAGSKHIMGVGIIAQEEDAMVDSEVTCWDDVTGTQLRTDLVRTARAEELKHLHRHGVYTKVPIEKCWAETGKNPVGTRWLDINKGDEASPDEEPVGCEGSRPRHTR